MKFYRNNIDIVTSDGDFVDAESLWRKDGQLMILEDEDRYVTFPYSESKFYEVNLQEDGE